MSKLADYKKLAADAQALAEQATSGPWVDYRKCITEDLSETHLHLSTCVCIPMEGKLNGVADDTFIAASRTLVPDLAEAVLRLTAALERCKKQRDAWASGADAYLAQINCQLENENAELERILAGDDSKGAGDGEG